MLDFQIVVIDEGEDFSKLISFIDPKYIDESALEELNKSVTFLSLCKRVVIEYPYMDKDYLSNFYSHHSKKFKKIDKECCRLLFFADDDFEDFMGCVTLFPSLTQRHLGRFFIDPSYVIYNEEAHLITSDFKIHLPGTEILVDAFPEIKQIDPCVCGHTAIWGIINFRSHWKEYASKTSSEIEATTPFYYKRESQIDGVSISQMSEILYKLGCNPISKSITNKTTQKLILEELFVYIESKMPVLIISEQFHHAIIGVGYTFFQDAYEYYRSRKQVPCMNHNNFDNILIEYNEDDEIKTDNIELLYASNLINDLYVNDDNSFPYKKISHLDKDTNKISLERISGFIVPIYPRINLNYIDIKILIKEMLTQNNDIYGFTNFDDKQNVLIPRVFMTSSNTYREYLVSCLRNYNNKYDDGTIKIYELIRNLELSKIIWVVELANFAEFKENKFSSLMIFDSTASLKDEHPYLFIFGQKQFRFYLGECRDNKYPKSPDNQDISNTMENVENYPSFLTNDFLSDCMNKKVLFTRFNNQLKNIG